MRVYWSVEWVVRGNVARVAKSALLVGFCAVSLRLFAAQNDLPLVPGCEVSVYAVLLAPRGLSFDLETGILYVGNDSTGENCRDTTRVRRVGPDGVVEEFGTPIEDPDAVLFDPLGCFPGTEPGSLLVAGRSFGVTACNTYAQIQAFVPDDSGGAELSVVAPGSFNNGLKFNPTDMVFDMGALVLADGGGFGAGTNGGFLIYDACGIPPTRFLDLNGIASILPTAGGYLFRRSEELSRYDVESEAVTPIVGQLSTSAVFLVRGTGGDVWKDDVFVVSCAGELLRVDSGGRTAPIGTGFDCVADDAEFGPDNALYVSQRELGRILRIAPQTNMLPPPVRFVRGDTDQDGSVIITDGIFILGFLFLGTNDELSCHDAADVDDSGSLELSDAIYLFNWLFLGGEEPPAPGPDACGVDPTKDCVDCASFEMDCTQSE